MLKKPSGITVSLIGGAIFFATLAYCAPRWAPQQPGEFYGQVLDQDTKQPIEGAYALLVYIAAGGVPMGHSASWCVRTRGMFTGKDGKFSFPVDTEGGGSPLYVEAIKPNYFTHSVEMPRYKGQVTYNPEAKKDWDIFLKKQDPAKPNFRYGFRYCERPESRAGADPAIEFLRIQLNELIRYGVDERGQESTLGFIKHLQSAPDKK